MDITGARWDLKRTEAILKLCSLKVSGDLAAYLAFHFEQAHKPWTADPSGRARGGLKWTVCQLHNGTEKPI